MEKNQDPRPAGHCILLKASCCAGKEPPHGEGTKTPAHSPLGS